MQLYETVLGGMDEALHGRRVDLAITPHVPQGFGGEPLIRLRFVAAAHPDHPLHHLGRPATLDDLSRHRHLVIRDSATERPRDSGGWVKRSIASSICVKGTSWFTLPTALAAIAG